MRPYLPFAPLVLLTLAACKPVGPDYRPPRPALPAAFEAGTGAQALGPRWWTLLADPALDALEDRALAASPDLAAAAARLRQARAQLGIAEAQGGPALNLDAKASRDRLSRNGEMFANIPLPDPRTDFTVYNAGFDASWELDLFGRQRRLEEGARARAGAAGARLADARLVVAAEVARAYLDLRLAEARLALGEATLRDLDARVRLLTLAQGAGDTAEAQVRQAEAERDGHASGLEGLRVARRQSRAALSVLTGLDGAGVDALAGAGGLPAVPGAPAAGLPSDLLNRRPDLRGAERDLAAASADVGVAVAQRYPRFSLVGSGGWNSVRSGDLFEAASRAWSLGPQLSLPLFDRGQRRAQVRVQEAAFDAAQAAYHKAVLAALADADLALARVGRSEEARRRTEAAADAQARVLALVERQRAAGEASTLNVLEARRAASVQRDQALQARAQSLAALVSLCKALGGGWDGRS